MHRFTYKKSKNFKFIQELDTSSVRELVVKVENQKYSRLQKEINNAHSPFIGTSKRHAELKLLSSKSAVTSHTKYIERLSKVRIDKRRCKDLRFIN